MFCPDCGNEIAPGRVFCGKCGARLHAAAATAVPQSSPVPTAPASALQPPRPPSPYRWVVYAGVLLLAALLGVAWWWFHRPPPPYQVQDPGVYPYWDQGKVGFVDSQGNVLVQPQWDDADSSTIRGQLVYCSEGLCGVRKDGKWGFVDAGGRLTISNQFDLIGPFVEGLARAYLGNQIGYIDKTGRYVVNPQFDNAGDFHEGLAAVHSDGLWGFINKSGTFVIRPRFQNVAGEGFSQGLAPVCIPGKCGHIDHSGSFKIAPQFNSVNIFSEGLAAVRVNDKWGFVDASGRIVINPQFDSTTMFSGGLAVVTVSGHAGTIDKQGKYVVNPGQYNIQPRDGDLQPASSSDGLGLLTRDGRWAVNPTISLTGIGAVFGKVFLCNLEGQQGLTPVSISGKVLAGPYKGSMLALLAQDIQDETSAIQSMHTLTAAETAYSGTYPTGFTDSLEKLGPATGTPDQNHAGLIDATLATGTKDGYQFAITIPAGTSTGGSNFNYFLVAKPASGHAGRTFCADSSGTVRYAEQGQNCTTSSPVL